LTFAKDSLILINYTAKVKDTGEVFETTYEDEAKKHNFYNSDVTYCPKLVAIGESWVIKGLDDALANTNVGDKTSMQILPTKGFGERDPGKVRMMPLRKLGENADKVSVGDSIEVDNRKGIIRFIGSGRIQIDFNHRFAGKTIIYDVDILKLLDTDEDKIASILQRHINIPKTKLTFQKTNSGMLNIHVHEDILRLEGLQIIKHLVKSEIFKFISTINKINFIETYVKPTMNKQKTQS